MDSTLQKTKRLPITVRPLGRFFARLLLASVFAIAAFAKLQNFSQLERTLTVSRLIPTGLVPMVSCLLIAVEFTIALGLMVPFLQPVLQKMSLHLAMLLSVMFISYSSWRIVERIPVPCHCFGALFQITPPESILLNLGLLSLIVFLLNGMNMPLRNVQASSAA